MSATYAPIDLAAFAVGEGSVVVGPRADRRTALMEFHISRTARLELGVSEELFSLTGNVVLADFQAARNLAARMNAEVNPLIHPERFVKAGHLAAMGLIDEVLHYVAALYRQQVAPDAFSSALEALEKKLGAKKTEALLERFCREFPPLAVYRGELTVEEYLSGTEGGEDRRVLALEELLLLRLANENPAFEPFLRLFDEGRLRSSTAYEEAVGILDAHFAALPPFGPDNQDLATLLRSPAVAEPHSLTGQLDYIRRRWGLLVGSYLLRLLTTLDVVAEENKPSFSGPGPTAAYVYDQMEHEYERFTEDKDWMPRTVLMAKSVLVWLHQLSISYDREITRLDQIPDEELDTLARRGFTGLWLIGLWERSPASREIKRRMGNPEAAASAYSLYEYRIADELGGWESLRNLRERCAWRGIRLGSDMVPNHTGIDSRWIAERPDLFLQTDRPPFPGYTFYGDNLSSSPGVGVYLEDHYWNRSDAAVVFKRVEFSSGEVRYIYHGNDGTSMPWNDTAQIDFLNAEARKAVQDAIVQVCREFPIVRFDAAMTLAKRHVQRLWYPEPGHGGAIPSRAEYGLSKKDFDRRMPAEFWREVVDRCAVETPDTLLLAEAFWMMEGYFVRTLGMHRVYNSAFMNMLKNEENGKYRATIKNTLEFDPEILKRFVNFMNNPDEDTAVAQFGRGDKYFGVCTLMATMPGLPMFGHGQIEGFEEKYGMEFRRSYRDEKPDRALIERHEREVFPLLKRRSLFSGSSDFNLYDLETGDGRIEENVLAYTNRAGNDRSLVIYNNAFPRTSGWIRHSIPALRRHDDGAKALETTTLGGALGAGGSTDRYMIMREQRSSLWYIRRSSELVENGLFVALDGYQCQVFLEIHEVQDTEGGRYRRLCDELAGRGVADLESAFQEIFLRDLYTAFLEVAKPAYFEEFAAFAATTPAASGRRTKFAPFLEALREPILRFASIAAEYVDGASGAYDRFDRGLAEPRDAQELWEDFALSLLSYAKLVEWTRKPPATLSPVAAAWLAGAAEDLGASPKLAEYLAGYLVLTMLRGVVGRGASGDDGRRLVDHWCLDRKLRESYAAAGCAPDEAYTAVTLMKLLLARTAKPADERKPLPGTEKENGEKTGNRKESRGPAAELAIEAFTCDECRSFLGANVFEGVPWFNKERFEEALRFGGLVAVIDGDDIREKRRKQSDKRPGSIPHPSQVDGRALQAAMERVAVLSAKLSAAEAASGYRIDRFIDAASEALPPKDGPKRSSRRDTSSSKRP